MSAIAQKLDLSGRRALITGAAGALGQAMVKALSELGAELLLVDHPTSVQKMPLEASGGQDGRLCWLECDLELDESRAELISTVSQSAPSIDILINNAAFVGTSGLQGWSTAFEQQTVETWRRAMEVNLTAVFDLCKGFAPHLRSSGRGSVINIASIYGLLGPDYSLYEGTPMGNPAAYAASKGGLLQLTRWLSTTLAPEIRVNAISPGGIFRNQPSVFIERYITKTPLRRMATEDDIMGAVVYLASDLSPYVTGQNLVVDGGWSAW